MNINNIIIVVLVVWSVVLSGALIWVFVIFKDLIKISKNKEFSNNTKEIKEIWEVISGVKKEAKFSIQKTGLVKFNPFEETGGEHSFSLALLDGNKNGIIITSLHTRERTRLYLKDVVLGKSKASLSNEEGKALKLANGKN